MRLFGKDSMSLKKICRILSDEPCDKAIHDRYIVKWDGGGRPRTEHVCLYDFFCEIHGNILPVPDEVIYIEVCKVDAPKTIAANDDLLVKFGQEITIVTDHQIKELAFIYYDMEDVNASLLKLMDSNMPTIDNIIIWHHDGTVLEFLGCHLMVEEIELNRIGIRFNHVQINHN